MVARLAASVCICLFSVGVATPSVSLAQTQNLGGTKWIISDSPPDDTHKKGAVYLAVTEPEGDVPFSFMCSAEGMDLLANELIIDKHKNFVEVVIDGKMLVFNKTRFVILDSINGWCQILLNLHGKDIPPIGHSNTIGVIASTTPETGFEGHLNVPLDRERFLAFVKRCLIFTE